MSAYSSQLLAGFFQVAYATNDLAKAMKMFEEKFSVKHFHQMLNIPFTDDVNISIATAYLGEVMIEIIQPHGPGPNIYDSVLPSNGRFAVRHHHLGHLFTDEAEYQRCVSQAGAQHPLLHQAEMPGFIKAAYIDTYDELGQYLEYVYCTPEGLAFLNQAPRN